MQAKSLGRSDDHPRVVQIVYTLSSNYYMEKAVFREDTFYLIPADKVEPSARRGSREPRIYHWCPELAKFTQDDVGIIFYSTEPEEIKCDRCKKTPGDEIITVYTLLKEK